MDKEPEWIDLNKLTRLEVVSYEAGRLLAMHEIEVMEFSMQDDDRTLKIFVKKRK